MPRLHTHYDNLKVTRNAPPEIIRAAYKTLSQKFHPDRNPSNPNATRTFQMISLAYEVLSDPIRRRDHDDWIARMEAEQEAAAAASQAAIMVPATQTRVQSGRRAPGAWIRELRRLASAFHLPMKFAHTRTRIGSVSKVCMLGALASVLVFGFLSG
ncbi:MAG: hypothetical protein JWQ23_3146 [Herminiimonas sp.]|nr:hypothetical protein [Herminiimonas sp.]